MDIVPFREDERMAYEIGPKVVLRGWVARTVVLVSLVALLAGCPTGPLLMVSPGALDFETVAARKSFTIINTGIGQLVWSVEEVVWAGFTQGWVSQDVPWLSVDPQNTAGTATTEIDRVFLNVSRDGLAAGTYSGTGVRVLSNGGEMVVPVSLTISGAGPGPGEGDLRISPTSITINGLTDTASFTATNQGNALVSWYTDIRINHPSPPANAKVQIAATPSKAATPPGYATSVTVSVPDPDTFNTAFLNYVIDILDSGTNELIGTVSVMVDLTGPAAITLDPTLLDFGKDGYQLDFLVVNTGDASSLLDFAFFEEVSDGVFVPYDFEDDPLLAAMTAPKGTQDVQGHPSNPWLNARQVTATISRDGLEQDIEYREVWVGAVSGVDGEGNPILDTEIEPQMLQLRVLAASSVEGAINRSRPPSVMKFVFMLRDRRGVAVDASDPLIRNQIRFAVEEDDFPLDLAEANVFVTGPENLTCNMVILLDFTGSMYQAGVNDPTNPLLPGEAIEQMKQGAAQFIMDLPASYRVAVMEYHDRNQPTRVIHSFDTNREALVTSLQAFDLPEAEHGASELHDAMLDAAQRVVGEDPAATTLPFDEADIRAVVVIADGWDTSSVNSLTEVIDYAKDNRVRFYPLGYSGRLSNPVNSAALIQLASETGGHNYYAPEVTDLALMLDTDNNLTFADTSVNLDTRTAVLRIRNIGSSPIAWRAIETLDWLQVNPLAGTVPALARNDNGVVVEPGVREATITLATGLAAGDYEGVIDIDSLDGDASVIVRATVLPGDDLLSLSVIPQTTGVGKIWREFRGQIVLTYTSLLQEGTHTYNITASFPDGNGDPTSAEFEEDGVFYPGDTRAGQISLNTTGVQNGTAEIYVRTNYVPRNIHEFRFRFILEVPEALTPTLTPAERTALRTALRAQLEAAAVALAPDGLLSGWRIIKEGNGVFTLVAPEGYLPYGSFGNLLRLHFDGLGANDAFTVGFRVDNSRYYVPTLSKYFLYPGGALNPTRVLKVAKGSDTASPAATVGAFTTVIDPEAPGVWDRDSDSWQDFDDSGPDDNTVGDADDDGVPDLDDPDPNNPLIP